MSLPDELLEDPIVVEKVHPDGYMILNGHHRWAASMGTMCISWRRRTMSGRIKIIARAEEIRRRESPEG